MLYDLSKELDKSRFARRVAQLERAGSVVELAQRKERSLKQNAYLHLIIGYLACETGYTLQWVKENCYKRTVNPDLFVRKVDGPLGGGEDLRSITELTSEELSLSIDRFRNWSSAEAGIYLPSPNESEFLREIELELDRMSRYV